MRLLFVVILVTGLAACTSGPTPIATAVVSQATPTALPATADLPATVAAVAATQAAVATVLAPTATPTTGASNLPSTVATATQPNTAAPSVTSTSAPRPTRTPAPTRTPVPATPTPHLTPFPTFQPVSQTIGVMAPGAPESQANVEVRLLSVRPWPGDQYHQPPPGHVFLVVEVELRNQGPASVRTLNSFDFQMIDANRAIQYPRLMPPTQDCPLRLVELLPGGWLQACFGYAVMAEGPIEFIVAPAPRRAAGLKAGDYLSFPLRRT